MIIDGIICRVDKRCSYLVFERFVYIFIPLRKLDQIAYRWSKLCINFGNKIVPHNLIRTLLNKCQCSIVDFECQRKERTEENKAISFICIYKQTSTRQKKETNALRIKDRVNT